MCTICVYIDGSTVQYHGFNRSQLVMDINKQHFIFITTIDVGFFGRLFDYINMTHSCVNTALRVKILNFHNSERSLFEAGVSEEKFRYLSLALLGS